MRPAHKAVNRSGSDREKQATPRMKRRAGPGGKGQTLAAGPDRARPTRGAIHEPLKALATPRAPCAPLKRLERPRQGNRSGATRENQVHDLASDPSHSAKSSGVFSRWLFGSSHPGAALFLPKAITFGGKASEKGMTGNADLAQPTM